VSHQLIDARRQYWDITAETYDQIFPETLIGRAQRDAVWRKLERVFESGQRILELNCGTGIDAVHLAQRGIQVLACDLSPRMIELATGRSVAANVANLAAFRVMPTEDIAQLAEQGPFDGAFSNFSGLNCVEDLSLVAHSLAQLLGPGAKALICMVGRIAPWEIAWYLGHGEARKAMRRLRPFREDPRVQANYPSVRAIARAFAPGFQLRSWQGIGVAVPPSCMEPWACRFPKLLNCLAQADRWLALCPIVKGLADCVLLQFERATI
jgi:SAM-dependent methyltransferase